MPERRTPREYVAHVAKQSMGLGAIDDDRRAAFPERDHGHAIPPEEVPAAFQSLQLDTSGLRDPLSFPGKAAAASLQFILPAIYRSLPSHQDINDNHDDEALTRFIYSACSDISVHSLGLIVGGISLAERDYRLLAATGVAKVAYNLGVQVVPDAVSASKNRAKTIFSRVKSSLRR